MKRLKNTFTLVILFLGIHFCVNAVVPRLSVVSEKKEDTLHIKKMVKEIEIIENERTNALLKNDYAYLEQMMSVDCIHIESNGTLRTAAEFIRSFKNGDFVFREFEITENHIRIYGHTAIVTGKYHNIIVADQQTMPRKFALHTRMYVKRGGRWFLVSHQATETKQ